MRNQRLRSLGSNPKSKDCTNKCLSNPNQSHKPPLALLVSLRSIASTIRTTSIPSLSDYPIPAMNTTPFRDGVANGCDSGTGIMLFGVRLTEGSSSFRKSASMTNLSQLDLDHAQDPVADVATGYASDDLVHASGRGRERKRGTPWTEEEHRLFLMGLQLVGKGDWRGISRNFVKSRTPTQVASHAQKYFLRQNNHNRRRRRSSLFDITSDAVASSNMEEDDQARQRTQVNQSVSVAVRPLTCPVPAAPVSISSTKTLLNLEASPLTLGQPGSSHSRPNHHRRHHHTKTNSNHIRSIPIPPSGKLASLNLNPSTIPDPLPLSLKLPTGSVSNSPASSSSSAFQGVPQDSLNSSGDSMISVA